MGKGIRKALSFRPVGLFMSENSSNSHSKFRSRRIINHNEVKPKPLMAMVTMENVPYLGLYMLDVSVAAVLMVELGTDRFPLSWI